MVVSNVIRNLKKSYFINISIQFFSNFEIFFLVVALVFDFDEFSEEVLHAATGSVGVSFIPKSNNWKFEFL
jgi:hypothetical protein